jgi:hypothetical protein
MIPIHQYNPIVHFYLVIERSILGSIESMDTKVDHFPIRHAVLTPSILALASRCPQLQNFALNLSSLLQTTPSEHPGPITLCISRQFPATNHVVPSLKTDTRFPFKARRNTTCSSAFREGTAIRYHLFPSLFSSWTFRRTLFSIRRLSLPMRGSFVTRGI